MVPFPVMTQARFRVALLVPEIFQPQQDLRGNILGQEISSVPTVHWLETDHGMAPQRALAVVEAGHGKIRIRWMTVREYASLQGAADFKLHAVTETQAKFAMGDAVCVPAISWIMREYTANVDLER